MPALCTPSAQLFRMGELHLFHSFFIYPVKSCQYLVSTTPVVVLGRMQGEGG